MAPFVLFSYWLFFFFFNLSGAFLLHKWLRLLDAITGSWSYLVYHFVSLLLLSPGLPGLSFKGKCLGSMPKSCAEAPFAGLHGQSCLPGVWDWSRIWVCVYEGPSDLGGPTWSCCCCRHGLSLCGFDPTVIRTRDEEFGQRHQPGHYLLLPTACPWEIVWSVPVMLRKVVSFPTYTKERLQVVSDFHLYDSCYLWGNKIEDTHGILTSTNYKLFVDS